MPPKPEDVREEPLTAILLADSFAKVRALSALLNVVTIINLQNTQCSQCFTRPPTPYLSFLPVEP